jgi:hypothetical protein
MEKHHHHECVYLPYCFVLCMWAAESQYWSITEKTKQTYCLYFGFPILIKTEFGYQVHVAYHAT